MEANKANPILTNNLWQLMLRMSWSGILGMMMVSIDLFVDAIYVGQMIGQQALAGMSLAMPLTMLVSAVSGMIAAGSASFLSRAIGAGAVELKNRIFTQACLLSILFSSFLALLGYFFAYDMLLLMSRGNSEILVHGYHYLFTLLAGSFFSVIAVATSAMIRAEGKVKRAMIHASIAVIINILLNPFFIIATDYSTAGPALSTVCSMAIFAIINTHFLLVQRKGYSFKLMDGIGDKKTVIGILSVGVSALLLQSSNLLRQVIIFSSMASLGSEEDLAFLGAVFRIFMFSVIPVFGMLQALQPVVGMNYGVGKVERSIGSVAVFRLGAIGLLTLMVLPSLLFPAQILSVMLPDTSFSDTALLNFRIIMFFLPFTSISSTSITFFQSIGRGKLASLLVLGRQLGLFIPLIYLFVLGFGLNGIYYCLAVENILFALIALIVCQGEFKKLRSLHMSKKSFFKPI